METSDRGFLPLSESSLAAMQEAGVSVYVLHTPLDVHGSVSTSRALARELGLRQLTPYYEVPGGYAGVYGHLPASLEFGALLDRVRAVSGVPDVNFVAYHQDMQQIAVLAGGTDVPGIQEAEALGCHVMVTGTYDNLVQTDIGRQYKQAFEWIKDSLKISLIECSHYASEAVVMHQDMVDLCVTRFDLPCQFVPQDDPWL
jgi:putative NIF3 family GTP cyclohydrolase 1 type 2